MPKASCWRSSANRPSAARPMAALPEHDVIDLRLSDVIQLRVGTHSKLRAPAGSVLG